jgi:YD repeat-containing protein
VLTETDPAGNTKSVTYDLLDRPVIATDAEQRQVLTCYNASGQVLEQWRGRNITVLGVCGSLPVSPNGVATLQRYMKNVYGGPGGQITQMIDPTGNITQYSYQGMGRLVATTFPPADGATAPTIEWTVGDATFPGGAQSVRIDRQGRSTYSYANPLGKVQYVYSQAVAGTFERMDTYWYDAAGNPVWSGEHDYASGRLRRARHVMYDAADRLDQEWTNWSYAFDASGAITDWWSDTTGIDYGVDAAGNRTTVRYWNNARTAQDYGINYSYDALNRMTEARWGAMGWILNQASADGWVTFSHDTASRRTSVTRGNGTTTRYAYTLAGHTDWEQHAFQGSGAATGPDDSWFGIDYQHDLSGRLVRTSATDSRILGALPAAGSNGPANGLNQVAVVAGRAAALSWSAAGNMATDGRGWAFTHDGFNRMVRAVNAGSGVTLDFAYDTKGGRSTSGSFGAERRSCDRRSAKIRRQRNRQP